MTALNKQELREAAENATEGQWVVELGDEVYAVDGDDSEQIAMVFSDNGRSDAAFIAVASPVAVLSLLDENLQLQRDKDSLEAVAVAMRDDMRDAREKLEAAEKRIAELEARALNPAILDVIAEHQRQKTIECWTPEHDDKYQNSELADAAACYAIHAHNQGFSTPAHWPWSPDWWKQSGARRDLVKAGALILAEIERIDRAAGIGVKGE
ncbi:ead/Ea22-like family protein [Citrobacter freundii]|uniref:ead/Ea22-like family protein n=1 Tax=Citrobacter freundii TaxID=546 RepID=UPI0040420B4A